MKTRKKQAAVTPAGVGLLLLLILFSPLILAAFLFRCSTRLLVYFIHDAEQTALAFDLQYTAATLHVALQLARDLDRVAAFFW